MCLDAKSDLPPPPHEIPHTQLWARWTDQTKEEVAAAEACDYMYR